MNKFRSPYLTISFTGTFYLHTYTQTYLTLSKYKVAITLKAKIMLREASLKKKKSYKHITNVN
jgi:hypothetical protein